MPNRKDFSDAVLTIRYYLGLSDNHAAFDRFDYRQKFEYWGLLLGGVLMVGTGLDPATSRFSRCACFPVSSCPPRRSRTARRG